MNKIRECAWWLGWLSIKRKFWFITTTLVPSTFISLLSAHFLGKTLENKEFTLWSAVFLFFMFIGIVLLCFFMWTGTAMSKYTDDSKNWRLVVDKGWEFANKSSEAYFETKRRIEKLKLTKDPTELNEFMKNWKSRKQKKEELLRKLEYQLLELKAIEDIMSGKRAEQIKEEIKKTKEEIRKT